MKSILQHAELMESKLNSRLKKEPNPYTLKYASVWVLTPTLGLKRVAKARDIYELLEARKTLMAIGNAESFTVLTCGWAAPLQNEDTTNDELAPSQHPERRRVRLTVSVNDSGVASVLRFQDKPNEKTVDEGTARGSLADAVQNLMNEVISHQKKKKVKK